MQSASLKRIIFMLIMNWPSFETIPEAIQMIKDACDMCAIGNIHLHKFVSTSRSHWINTRDRKNKGDKEFISMIYQSKGLSGCIGGLKTNLD